MSAVGRVYADCELRRLDIRGILTVDADVSAVLQPLYEHIKAVLCELVPQPRCFFIRVAEVLRGMALPLTAPTIDCLVC